MELPTHELTESCRFVEDFPKAARGDGASQEKAMAKAMATVGSCEIKSQYCDKRQDLLGVNKDGSYVKSDWVHTCRINYHCGAQRRVCQRTQSESASKQ